MLGVPFMVVEPERGLVGVCGRGFDGLDAAREQRLECDVGGRALRTGDDDVEVAAGGDGIEDRPRAVEQLGGNDDGVGAAGLRPVRVRYWNSLLLPLMVAHRKLRARAPEHGSDVAPFSPWLDRSLHAATVLEQGLARRGLAFPAGGSILLTAMRP